MGFLSGIGKKVGGFVADRKADKYSKPSEAAALATSLMEGSMSPTTRKWVEALFWTLVGGLAAPALDLVSMGHLPPLHGPEGQALLHLSLTTGIMTFAAYWRKHPRPAADLGNSPDADALVSAVLDAAQKGMLSRAHVIPLEDAALIAHRLSVPAPRPGGGPALIILLATMLTVPIVAGADDQPAQPPVRIDVAGGVEMAMSPAGSKAAPSARVSIEGPLVLGASRRGLVGATVDILGLPGTTTAPALDSLETWTAIRAEGALGVVLGDLSEAGQHVQTRLVLFGGFSNRFGTDPAPVDRTARAYGLGLELREMAGGARVRVALGHDDAVSTELGRGHILIAGSVPIAGTHGIVAIGAEAALALGHADGITSTDRITVRLLASPPK